MSSDSSQEAAAAIDQQFQGQFGLGTWDVIAVIAYFVVILSVGLIVSSKPKNNSIFYLFVGNYYTFPQNILSHRRFSGRTETPWPDFPCRSSHVLAPRGFLTVCQQYRE